METTGLNRISDKETRDVTNRFLSIVKSAFIYSFAILMDTIMFPIVLTKVIWAYQKESKTKKIKTNIIS